MGDDGLPAVGIDSWIWAAKRGRLGNLVLELHDEARGATSVLNLALTRLQAITERIFTEMGGYDRPGGRDADPPQNRGPADQEEDR